MPTTPGENAHRAVEVYVEQQTMDCDDKDDCGPDGEKREATEKRVAEPQQQARVDALRNGTQTPAAANRSTMGGDDNYMLSVQQLDSSPQQGARY